MYLNTIVQSKDSLLRVYRFNCCTPADVRSTSIEPVQSYLIGNNITLYFYPVSYILNYYCWLLTFYEHIVLLVMSIFKYNLYIYKICLQFKRILVMYVVFKCYKCVLHLPLNVKGIQTKDKCY